MTQNVEEMMEEWSHGLSGKAMRASSGPGEKGGTPRGRS